MEAAKMHEFFVELVIGLRLCKFLLAHSTKCSIKEETKVSLPAYPPIAYVGRTVFIIVTAIIFIIALLAYLRLRAKKTLLLTVGFSLFFIHGVLAVVELFVFSFNMRFTEGWHLLLDSVALLFILVGALKD